ncbi:MAG: hypothetical protein AAF483_06555 [Planctomycetota bacterium]
MIEKNVGSVRDHPIQKEGRMKVLKWLACLVVLTGSLSLTGCGGGDSGTSSGSETPAAEGDGSSTDESGTGDSGDGSTSK